LSRTTMGHPGTSTFNQSERNQDRNRVAFSLENFLDARMEDGKGNVAYNQWAIFRLNQGYDFQEATEDGENTPLTPLTAELIVTPFPTLDLRGSTGWDHYENTFTQTTLSGEFTVNRYGGRHDYYEINYQYYRYGENDQANINFRTNINLAYGFSWADRFKGIWKLKRIFPAPDGSATRGNAGASDWAPEKRAATPPLSWPFAWWDWGSAGSW